MIFDTPPAGEIADIATGRYPNLTGTLLSRLRRGPRYSLRTSDRIPSAAAQDGGRRANRFFAGGAYVRLFRMYAQFPKVIPINRSRYETNYSLPLTIGAITLGLRRPCMTVTPHKSFSSGA